MRRQGSFTYSSHENALERQSSQQSVVTETQYHGSSFLSAQFLADDSDQISEAHHDSLESNCSILENSPSQHSYIQNSKMQGNEGEAYLMYDPWNPAEPVSYFQQLPNDYCILPTGNGFHYGEDELCYSQHLQYKMPAVTYYGTVTILLRHLIRVDLTSDGSVSVYNYPSRSTTTLNAVGNKSYIRHPNGCVYFGGSVIHVRTGNNRLARVTPKGIAISHSMDSIAYFLDESGTKTTCMKFADLGRDLTMGVFHDGNPPKYEELIQDCFKMLSEAAYQHFSDGTEIWMIGKISIKQNRWGEVTVIQGNGHRTILASPTIRSATLESKAANIHIDCFSENYLTVQKGSCMVTAGFWGLIAQKRNQKAGLNRTGKLVLL